jgi:hypothetical protein
LNPRTLSPMASTLTITPSWAQFSGYGCDKRRTILCRIVKMYKKSRHTRSFREFLNLPKRTT